MDKTITISGKPVRFRKTGGTILRYKREFGRELNQDLSKIASVYDALNVANKLNENELKTEDQKREAEASMKKLMRDVASRIETEWMFDIAFIMAQQADPSITDELTWLDSFDDFDPWSVFAQLMDLIRNEQEIAPKNA